jgi:hypothetical protein
MSANVRQVKGMAAFWTMTVGMCFGCGMTGAVMRFVGLHWMEAMGIGAATGVAVFSLVAVCLKFGAAAEKNPRKTIGDVIAGNVPELPEEAPKA